MAREQPPAPDLQRGTQLRSLLGTPPGIFRVHLLDQDAPTRDQPLFDALGERQISTGQQRCQGLCGVL